MFKDRAQAGRLLAAKLGAYKGRSDVIVLGLPRGGVPVAFEVAQALNAPLDALVVRKLGTPGHEELAMGAIASGGGRVLNLEVIEGLRISQADLDAAETRELRELERRQQAYRANRPALNLKDKTVILVDDGLATGATMRAAVAAVGQQSPQRVVVAVPVGSPDTCDLLSQEADEVVALSQPIPFNAVGQWYQHFPQTSDQEVQQLLRGGVRD